MGLAPKDDEDKDESPGLIDLDMGQFGSGTMNDPLRHAMGMRSAQDACKMRMWNGFPTLFQNTIFHGEQDASIKELRHAKPLSDKLARSNELKALGNAALKAASAAETPKQAAPVIPCTPALPSDEEKALGEEIIDVEKIIATMEEELRELRKKRKSLIASRDALQLERRGAIVKAAQAQEEASALDSLGGPVTKQLEEAITNYEKAAGILRFVECIRPDWKNDDGSYKGIEDEHLKVDCSALEGDDEEAEAAKEMCTSCYLNIALASQKLGKFDQMKAACDEILNNINPSSVKALYRRAQARIAPTSSLDTDMDAAIQDLLAAAQLAPQNTEVRGLLAKLRADRKAQHNEDRSKFAGIFDRGEIVTNDPTTEGDGPDKVPTKMDIRDPKVQRMLDIRPGPGDY